MSGRKRKNQNHAKFTDWDKLGKLEYWKEHCLEETGKIGISQRVLTGRNCKYWNSGTNPNWKKTQTGMLGRELAGKNGILERVPGRNWKKGNWLNVKTLKAWKVHQ